MKLLRNIITLSLICLTLIWILQQGLPEIARTIRYMTLYSYNLFPTKTDQVHIVTIDEKTLSTLAAGGTDSKTLGLSRLSYMTVIEKLERAGVAGIAFDVVFASSSNEDANNNGTADEQEFAQMIKKYDNIVLGAFIGKGEKKEECTTDKKPTEKWIGGVLIKSNKVTETCRLVRSDSLLPNPLYEDLPWGVINAVGNTAEYRQMSFSDEDREILTLPLALLSHIQGSGGIQTQDIPRNKDNHMLIPFFAFDTKSQSMTEKKGIYTSFIDIYNSLGSNEDQILREKFEGKYVLIGERGTLIHDTILSPVTRTMMPGVETHAHVMQAFLDRTFLTPIEGALSWILIAGLVIGSVTLFLSFGGVTSFLIGLGGFLLIILVARVAFIFGYVFDISSLLLAVSGVTLPVTFFYRFFVVDRERRHIQGAFAHYLDPHIVDDIVTSGQPLELGGESKEITVLFSDIENFTTISEKNGPKQTFALMSSYLSVMTDILLKNGGTLDKYIGDAIMGFFGAPLPQSDHAERMCRTALEMRAALPAFNETLTAQGLDPIRFRIGIATGEAMIGNIGSQSRFSYTALGDTVNLSSRLEAINKDYHTYLCVSESTYLAVKDLFYFRQLDLIRVKGKEKAVAIYELLGDREEAIEMGYYEIYEQAFALYVGGDYHAAGELWYTISGVDRAADMMMRRCAGIMRGEETVENGVYTMHHK